MCKQRETKEEQQPYRARCDVCEIQEPVTPRRTKRASTSCAVHTLLARCSVLLRSSCTGTYSLDYYN